MSAAIDLTGQKFSRLFVVMRYAGERYTEYICLCDCGEYVTVIGKNLKRQTTRSCGCLQRELFAEYNSTRKITKPKTKKTICAKCGKERFVNSICKNCRTLYDKAYYEKHNVRMRKEHSAQGKLYYAANKDKINTRRKAYEKANKCKVIIRDKARHAIYYMKNKKRLHAQRNQRRRTFSGVRLRANMSAAIYSSLKNGKANRSWLKLVDYTIPQLKKHLEKQFTEGMAWNNYGKDGWELDHIIPITVFNFTTPEHRDFKRCWALKNLQPLWSKTNRTKSAKLTKHFQPSLLI